MQKRTAIVGILFVAAFALILLGITLQTSQEATITGNVVQVEVVDEEPTEEVEFELLGNANEGLINKEASLLRFEGFALGGAKSHDGTFDDWTASAEFDGDSLISVTGSINMNSVNTGIGGLDSHLKNADFFDAENHPQATFSSKQIIDGQITGDLTFRGVTQEITFPAEITENNIVADFVFDAGQFGFDAFGVSNNVDVSIKFVFG